MQQQQLGPPGVPMALAASAASDAGGVVLFVYNMPPDTDDADVYKLFSPFGAITKVNVRFSTKDSNSFRRPKLPRSF